MDTLSDDFYNDATVSNAVPRVVPHFTSGDDGQPPQARTDEESAYRQIRMLMLQVAAARGVRVRTSMD